MQVICYHCKKEICKDIRKLSCKEFGGCAVLVCPYCDRVSFLGKKLETNRVECIHKDCEEDSYAVVETETDCRLACCEKHALEMCENMPDNIRSMEVLNPKAWVVGLCIFYRDEEDVVQSESLVNVENWVERNKYNVFGKEKQRLSGTDIYFLQQGERRNKESLDRCGKAAAEKVKKFHESATKRVIKEQNDKK